MRNDETQPAQPTGSADRSAETPAEQSQTAPVATTPSTSRSTQSGSAMRNDESQPAGSMGSADRSALPETAVGWLGLLMSGSALSAAGVALRRRKA